MDWSALADELGKRGIVDGNGKPPTAERTHKAWWQVGRDKEAVAAGAIQRRRRAKQAQAVLSPPASAVPVGGSGLLPPGIKLVEPEPPEGRYQFHLAGGPKIWALPHFAWSHPSSVRCQVIDPKMESALTYLAVHDTLAEASRCEIYLGLQ